MRSRLFTTSLSLLLAMSACSKSRSGSATESTTTAPTEVVEDTTEVETTAHTDEGEPGDATAEFPNLKALPKSWGEAELISYMKGISNGLGVQCDYCHDVENKGEETEMKGRARAMIEMAMSLDKEYFEGKGRLACITCHKGKTEPSGG